MVRFCLFCCFRRLHFSTDLFASFALQIMRVLVLLLAFCCLQSEAARILFLSQKHGGSTGGDTAWVTLLTTAGHSVSVQSSIAASSVAAVNSQFQLLIVSVNTTSTNWGSSAQFSTQITIPILVMNAQTILATTAGGWVSARESVCECVVLI